ncbi:hypothetical protein [Rubrivirga sp. IMCC43871]|uniref:hypothetical protein n=1 Tax=Rubrivirga sp. IMCC43871 TaxID=3391575 RepID=UPI003990361C
MNNLFRGLLAGYGAKKLGGGCFSTVLVFILLWVLLGQCGSTMPPVDDASEAAVTAVEAPASGVPSAPSP